MKLGVVGLPNVGKSTLFNAITQAGAECANYPFCTIEPNVGMVAVPDERLGVLAKMYTTRKVTPAVIEFVDIAGLVKGASKGEGLGNKFLSHIREVDAIVHTVRCFDNGNIIHVSGAIDPLDDIDTIETELILADIDTVAARLERAGKAAKGGDKKYNDEIELLKRIHTVLCDGKPARLVSMTDEERALSKTFFLLTTKPTIFVANIDENAIGQTDNAYVLRVKERAAAEHAEVVVLSAKIEEELAQLDESDRQAFREDLGLKRSGLDELVEAGYRLLGLMSYLTAGEQEVRAWTITRGTKAPQAAGKIHSDFERGFIRAEVVSYERLVEAGSLTAAKERGWLRSEGKEYVMQDGDVVLFRFNV